MISGTIGSNTNWSNAMRDMAMAGAVRGTDGFGMFQVEKLTKKRKKDDPPFYLNKMVNQGMADILAKGRFSGFLSDAKNCLLTVGHHRAATIGVVDEESAQPFAVQRADGSWFTGVHNGTLSEYMLTGPNNAVYQSDSEWALNQLAADYDGALSKKIRGAYTFVTYDTAKPEEVIISTSGDRPLAFAFADDLNVMMFASEADMLHWVMKRNKITIKGGTVYECQPNKKYVFNVGDLEKYTQTLITRDYSTPSVYSGKNSGNFTSTRRDYSRRSMGTSAATQVDNRYEQSVKDMIRKAIEMAKSGATVSTPSTPTTGGVTLSEPASKIVHRAEIEHLREAGFRVGGDGLFIPQLYDSNTHCLHGDVLAADKEGTIEMMSGIIRDMSTDVAEMYIRRFAQTPGMRELDVKVVGSYTYEKMDPKDKGVEMMLVCSHPTIPKEKPVTEPTLVAKES
jgi:hypothetical protein